MILRMLFFALSSLLAFSQPSPFEAQIQPYVDSGRFIGTVLVAKDGKVLYRKAFGFAQAEWEIPNTPETKFRIGSITKQIRKLIQEADPDVVEEWKWIGTPVWSHDGIICTGESYKKAVKLTFAKGASLKDPAGLFNSSLEGNVRRAIDIHEGEVVDESAFKALIRQAVALNSSVKSKPSKKAEP